MSYNVNCAVASVLLMGWVGFSFAADKPKPVVFTEAAAAGPDFAIQGEYKAASGKPGVQVIALGEGKFDAVVFPDGLPGDGSDGKQKIPLKGETKDGATFFKGETYSGELAGSEFKLKGAAAVDLKKVERVSPTAGAKPPTGAIVLFNGANVDQWADGKLEDGNLLGVGTRTKQKFKDYTLHLEFRTPFMPQSRGQGRGNSGMYLSDQYECQVLDSFGLNGEDNECGGFYKITKPLVNMCFPPLSWQTYDVEFTAAKFDAAGKKTAPAVVTVRQNGVVIHDKFEFPNNTPGGGETDESKPGSIFVQNHNDPVRFRNIWILEKK